MAERPVLLQIGQVLASMAPRLAAGFEVIEFSGEIDALRTMQLGFDRRLRCNGLCLRNRKRTLFTKNLMLGRGDASARVYWAMLV